MALKKLCITVNFLADQDDMQALSVSKVTVLLVDWGCQFGGHNALNAPNPIPMKQETARDVKGKGTVTQKARFHRHMKSLQCKGKSCVAGAEGGRARRRDRSSSSTSFTQLVMQFVVKDLTLIA